MVYAQFCDSCQHPTDGYIEDMEPGWQTLFESFPVNRYIWMLCLTYMYNMGTKQYEYSRSICGCNLYCLSLCSKYVKICTLCKIILLIFGKRSQNLLNEIKRTI